MLWKMGFSGAKIAPSPPYTPPGTIELREDSGSTIRNSRLATLPLASLLCSLDFRFACFAHCARPSCAPPTAAQCSGASHRPRLWRRGVPALRTPFGRVLAPPAALRPPTASDRDGNAFFPQMQAFALQKMPEMTYTPSFLIRASFFRDFVNTLRRRGFCPRRLAL